MARVLDADRFLGTPIAEDDPLHWYHLPLIGRLYHRRIDVALRLLGTGRRVLELGFGSGVSFLDLAGRYEEIHGVDRHPYAASIRDIYAREGVRLHLSRGSILDLPHASGTFDAVLAVSILEHLPPADQPRAMAEVQRVLRPGGAFVIGVPGVNRLMNGAIRLMGVDIGKHHLSPPRVVRAAAEQRFEIEETLRQPPLAPDWCVTYAWFRCRRRPDARG